MGRLRKQFGFFEKEGGCFFESKERWLAGSGKMIRRKKGGYDRLGLNFFENGRRWLGPKRKVDKGHFFCLKIGQYKGKVLG